MNFKDIWKWVSDNDLTNLMKNNDKGFSYKKATGIFILFCMYKLNEKVDASTLIMMAGIYAGLIGAIIGINTIQQVVNKKEDNKSNSLPTDKTT